MKKTLLTAALCAWLVVPCLAQELYVKSDRYAGPVEQRDGVVWVGAAALAELLKLQVTKVNDGYVIARPFVQHKDEPTPGTFIVEGTVVESQGGLVPLPAFAKALGLEVVGADGGALRINPPSGWIRGASQSAAPVTVVPEGPLAPLELNKGTAGQVIDWKPHLVRGRINLVHFWNRGEKDAGYRVQPTLLRKLAASRPDVYVILIEAGPRTSPLGAKVGMVPTTWLYSKALVQTGQWNGHSLNTAADTWMKNPQKLTDDATVQYR